MKITDFQVESINGEIVSLDEYVGKVLLIVNVASQCGFTPQYQGLEELYRKHKHHGFEILGFPCNQFLWQEKGSNEEIQKFCKLKYDVTFPVFAKIKVNGKDAHPLFQFLKSSCRGFLGTQAIKWNFTKFLVGRDGVPIRRFGTWTKPAAIEKYLVQEITPP